MMWEAWITLYTQTHCTARGLRSSSIAAYRVALEQFPDYARFRLEDKAPALITPCDVLEYLEHLRSQRRNGASAINRHVVILRSFYRAIVAMGHLAPAANPLANLPKIKGAPQKLPVVLSAEEIERLLAAPDAGTILGLRDRAILALLYGSGIRATECASLHQQDVDLDEQTVSVIGKGGHQRTAPLNERVVAALELYARVRGAALPTAPFFRSRRGRAMSRYAIYERVRTWAERARIKKRISPHRLRHTFATHLVRAGVGLVTIRDLLGHRLITSTQIYLHVTAQDLREAADRHPIGRLMDLIEHLLPDVKLPMQYAPGLRRRA
jgi:site-specific recombinase XerD